MMFHSAGYFRGVLCPFFEHELCHRAYCHFKHSKPGSAKSVSRLPPKLKTKLYQSRALPKEATDQPQAPDSSRQNHVTASEKPRDHSNVLKDHVGQLDTLSHEFEQEAGSVTKNVDDRKDDSMLTTVPEVKRAIGQIANYFGSMQPILEEPILDEFSVTDQLVEAETGSGSHMNQCDSVEKSTLSESEIGSLTSFRDDSDLGTSTAIGLLSHETIGRLAGEIAEQIAGTYIVKSDDKDVKVPSYAPEKCSTHDSGYTECVACVKHVDGVALLPDQERGSDNCVSVGVGDIEVLTNVLVTEKDIFGSPCHRDSCSDDVNVTSEPCKMSLEVMAVEQGGSSASAGCEDSKIGCGEGGSMDECNVFGRDNAASNCSASSGGVRGAVEAGSDGALIDANFEGSVEAGEDSVGGVLEKVSHDSKIVVGSVGVFEKVSNDSEIEAGCVGDERILEASSGDGGDRNVNLDGPSDKGIAYPLDDQRTMEEFQKLTSMEDDIPFSASPRKRKPSRSDCPDIPVKKKRRAYPQAESVGQREPARVGKAKTVDANFSSILKQTDPYMGKKRVANTSSTVTTTVAKRPRLLLTANARVSTKARQKYLDAFIDEHMRRGVPPQEAYQKGLEEEKEIHEQNINSYNNYLNKSHRALKQLRLKAEQYITEMKRRSDEQVQIVRETHTPNCQPEAGRRDSTASKSQVRGTNAGNKSDRKLQAKVVDGKKGWKCLEAELQAGFSQPPELVKKPAESCKPIHVLKSHSVAKKLNPIRSNFSDAIQATGEKKKTDEHKDAKIKSFYGKFDPPHSESSKKNKEESIKLTSHRNQKRSKFDVAISCNDTVKCKHDHSDLKSHVKVPPKSLSMTAMSEVQREVPRSKSFKSKDGHLSRRLKHIKKSSHHPIGEIERHSKCMNTDGISGSTKKLKFLKEGRTLSRDAKEGVVEVSDKKSRSLRPELSLKKNKHAGTVFEVGDSSHLLQSEQVVSSETKSGIKSAGRLLSPVMIDLTSELFGSDSEDSTSVYSVSSSSSKHHSTDSHESITDDIVEGASQKGLASKFPHMCRSPMWSSDNDSATNNISFECALNSIVEPVKVTKGANNCQESISRLQLQFSSTVKNSPVQFLFNKVPSLKLVRTSIVGLSKMESVEASTAINRSDSVICEEAEISAEQNTERTSDSQQQPDHTPIGPYISLSKLAKQRQLTQNKTVLSSQRPAKKHMKSSLLKKSTSKQKRMAISSSNFGIMKKREPPPLTGELFYAQMWTYVLTEKQLHDCGYPRPSELDGVATIHLGDYIPAKIVPVGPNVMRHECCRCHKPFNIYNKGQYQTIESCSYHYGKPFKYKECGEGMVSRYSCCKERSGSPGCQIAKLHVTAGVALGQDSGYAMTTSAAECNSAAGLVVYALDCEMCYTTIGLELTRVSVVDMTLQPVYESFVRPSHTIVDYNTRFSGLTGKDFIGVKKTLSDVQEDLLKLFTNETILVGHSLESDLKVLKLIHSRVVDTALVFPHRMGLPYKRALKTLTKDVLHKFIQNDIDDGHDSLEDSRACMELMLWKVKSDLRAMCRRTCDK